MYARLPSNTLLSNSLSLFNSMLLVSIELFSQCVCGYITHGLGVVCMLPMGGWPRRGCAEDWPHEKCLGLCLSENWIGLGNNMIKRKPLIQSGSEC